MRDLTDEELDTIIQRNNRPLTENELIEEIDAILKGCYGIPENILGISKIRQRMEQYRKTQHRKTQEAREE